MVVRKHQQVRYADDSNIDVKSKAAGERVLKSITRYVEQRLKLLRNLHRYKYQANEKSYYFSIGYFFIIKNIDNVF